MLRALVRLVLIVIVIAAAAAFVLGWWGRGTVTPGTNGPASTATAGHVDAQRARQVGAEVGERTAEAANTAGAVLTDAGLTAKIKSKMALDDQVRARSIDVSTHDHVVTLSGTVGSEAERDRALRLARETNGVSQVVDHLTITR